MFGDVTDSRLELMMLCLFSSEERRKEKEGITNMNFCQTLKYIKLMLVVLDRKEHQY